MHLVFLLPFFACLLSLAACSKTPAPETAPAEPAQAESTDGAPIIIGHNYAIKSEVLGMDRNIAVRLPYGYDQQPDRKFPVVYVVDGGAEQDFPHIAGIAQSREMNGTFSAFILVGIETVNRRHQIVPPATDVAEYEAVLGAVPGGSAKFRAFIRSDLMPWVNARYRTNGHDAFMGESLAGLFVIESLFEDPNLFDDYVAVTPSLWWENMKYGEEAADFIANLPSAPKRLYITSADEGFRHQGGIDKLIAALESGAPDTLKWTYIARSERETHGSIYHGAALDAFRKFFPSPVLYGRPSPLLTGLPLPPPTAEQEALYNQDCNVETSLQLTPGENLGEAQNANAFRCIVYHYGDAPTAGNMTHYTSAEKSAP